LIHPRNDSVEVAATHHFPLAADVQAAVESNQPGFEASLNDRILLAVRPGRAGLRARTDNRGTGVRAAVAR